jgi:hypothetical protein
MNLMKKHSSHKTIYRSEHKHEEQQTITREVITEFDTKLPTSPGLCLSGGGFFINSSMLAKYKKYIKWISYWSHCVLLDLINPTQLTTLKKTECSSQKWPAKVSSSTTSLHKNGFGLALLQHNSALTVLHGLKQAWFI